MVMAQMIVQQLRLVERHITVLPLTEEYYVFRFIIAVQNIFVIVHRVVAPRKW